jgi:hypothetical protein
MRIETKKFKVESSSIKSKDWINFSMNLSLTIKGVVSSSYKFIRRIKASPAISSSLVASKY